MKDRVSIWICFGGPSLYLSCLVGLQLIKLAGQVVELGLGSRVLLQKLLMQSLLLLELSLKRSLATLGLLSLEVSLVEPAEMTTTMSHGNDTPPSHNNLLGRGLGQLGLHLFEVLLEVLDTNLE